MFFLFTHLILLWFLQSLQYNYIGLIYAKYITYPAKINSKSTLLTLAFEICSENVLTPWAGTCCRVFTPCFNKVNEVWSLRQKKNFIVLPSMVWWHVYRYYRVFGKQPFWRYWPKKLFISTSWALAKNWYQKKVADLLYITYMEILKYRMNVIFLNKHVSNYLSPSEKIN